MTERAGYTVTMFLVDVSPSTGKLREVDVPLPNGEVQIVEMTNLEWALQYVKLKVQEMIYNGRKTDQCGVILFGTQETSNIVNRKDGGYEHVYEFVPIGTPTAATIAKINSICPAEEIGDPVDALIVGVETQDRYLGNKKTWTRKIVMLTDGENPIELEDWEVAIDKMNDLKIKLTVVSQPSRGIDFDDADFGYKEEDKSTIKRANEEFFHTFVDRLDPDLGIVGNCAFAIEEVSRPEVKQTKSALMANVLRLGDVENHPEEAIEIVVKTSKCTAFARPKSFKKFARLGDEDEDIIMRNTDDDVDELTANYGQLSMQTQYVYDPSGAHEDDDGEVKEEEPEQKKELVEIDKEDLVRGYKYGSSYVPVPDGNFPKLETKKGIEICGFFPEKNLRPELSMGEVHYVWADPASPLQQVAMSSIAEAMYVRLLVAIARWVTKDGAEPKMGILKPETHGTVAYFTWVQMPFADDIRKYTFPSLDKLFNHKGEVVTKHPYIATDEQMSAMDDFVDALDLMDAGEKDEEEDRKPWYDITLSYNPAIHRVKQALFHAAIVQDLNRQPLPPPHPELLKYFNAPRKVVKRARGAIEAARTAFNVKEVPKRVVRGRRDGHVRARDDGDDALLLDKQPNKRIKLSKTQSQVLSRTQADASAKSQQKNVTDDSETEPEDDEQDLLLNQKFKGSSRPSSPTDEDRLPTPSQTPVPNDDGRAPGRIIGTVAPLTDFNKNIAHGDLVTKAVEDLAFVIRTVVLRPFSASRVDEMLECMQALRKVCLEEDEIDAWNEFLPDLRRACLDDDPGNEFFWTKLAALGRSVSLISKSEAAQQGGKSDISDADAEQLYSTFVPSRTVLVN
ncbi:hypothetical protein PHLGIDRAFT_15192 [Phlebiopsis gigantea 11061_1 CR5-6]|uniref:ATP-dependent DNA helicase II subunit 2 n=1 Tax=Phlebiopsis gigantea (strain 11061_1 CR5-6) TaxID=745531 RepID=A0A0C3NHW4_PHLG1|nr:hypothetical protein PHLGIDRAFT_15192 [Phlebiopsis gigantea 11061_1 CR5-6]